MSSSQTGNRFFREAHETVLKKTFIEKAVKNGAITGDIFKEMTYQQKVNAIKNRYRFDTKKAVEVLQQFESGSTPR